MVYPSLESEARYMKAFLLAMLHFMAQQEVGCIVTGKQVSVLLYVILARKR